MSSPWVIANRFQISDPGRDLLARGGIGDVYRGTDLQTGQLVAIKALQPHIVASDADVVARFMREGQTLRVLDHPNIVKIVDAVRDEGRHYLAMEYVGGGSLRNLLDQRGALPIRRTLEIALDLSDALTRAHRFGVIHGDIKPSNVLLAEDGTPRLTDFGVAQFIDGAGLPHVGLLVGTVDYLSPEAYSGEPLDARADIWSFGVMLYEMLTGDRPFRGESVHSAITSIFTQPVPALLQACTLALEDIGQEECDDVPSALADLIYRMLEKDRDARIPSVRLVGAELEAILAEINGQSLAATHHVSLATRFARSLPPSVSLKHSLPTQSTRFVGRERDLAELDVLLARPEVRLVSILGPGGAGKTRL
ncbi:MAG: serine/threonine protein kinase, partial [Chloroflexi bacterium]|nr:serine/threonine protein kinase [Chloroflexota bacterium]